MKPAHLIAKPKSKPEAQAEIDSSSANKAEEEVANQVGVPRFLQQASGSGAASPRDSKTENNHTTNNSAPPAIQTKLTVGESDDEYERQADEVADKVASASAELPEVSQLPDVSQFLQTKSDHSQQQSTVASTASKQTQSSKPGEPLNRSVRAKVEPVLGADLSAVRVHNDVNSHQASQNLQAKAFTHQNNIYLGKNQSADDVKLMAHEATHVVQQGKSNDNETLQRQVNYGIPGESQSELSVNEEVGETSEQTESEVTSTPASEVQVNEEVSHSAELEESEEGETQGSVEAESETETENAGEDDAPEDGAEGEDSAGGNGEGEEQGGSDDEQGNAEAPLDAAEAGAEGETGLAELPTSELAVIDEELVEHQRWGVAMERVGAAESLDRAEFIAEAAGGGALGGFASGLAMGLGMGLVGRAAARFIPVPGVGGVLSGAMSVYGLASRDWSASGATISQFGEGASTYDTLANSIAAIAEIVDIVSNILGVVEGVVGVIQIGVYAVTAAAGVATVLTLGAAAPLLASMATLAETLTAISLALGVATTALDAINNFILQPAVLLFRALHAFTSEADPREIEAQGSELGQAAGAMGGAIGGALGARGAAAGSGRSRGGDADPPHGRPHADVPPARATGDGPSVRYETPSSRTGADTGGSRADTTLSRSTAAGESASRPAIPPPPNPDAPVPTIPPAPRVPDIPGTPATPGRRPPVDPYAPTQRPVDPLAPTERPSQPAQSSSTRPTSEAPTSRTEVETPSTSAAAGSSRPAIPPPPNPDAPNPTIPPPPRVPDIPRTPDHGPELPDWEPGVSPHAPTIPAADPYAPTQHPSRPPPSRSSGGGTPPSSGSRSSGSSTSATPQSRTEAAIPPGRRITDDQSSPTTSHTSPTASSAQSGSPQQLELPEIAGTSPGSGRRTPTPDEIAPADARSAYLRRLRAQAEGRIGPDGRNPDGPGRRPNNIARHEIPDRSSVDGIWQSSSPTPDLYQYSPRNPRGHESHHVEQQSAFRAPGGGEVVAGYNPREDVTVMMRRDPEHQATFAAQSEQRAQPDFHESVGTARALEEANNIAVWGTRDAPPPGSGARQLMDPRVAGQAVMEHSAYLFETSRLSDTFGGGGDITPRAGETPLSSRPVVGDLVGSRGGVDSFENIDWDATFDQPDPFRSAQPPGTQLALPSMEHMTQRPVPNSPEQLTLPHMDRPAPNPNQQSLPFHQSNSGEHRRVSEGATRSQRPLTDAEFEGHVAMAESMGMPRDQIQQGSGSTAYIPGSFDTLLVGPDIHPLPLAERPPGLANPANAALEPRAVLGHEIIGHREAELMGQVRDEPWHEELQASARAALHTPGLSREQSWLLLEDAAARRRHQVGDGEIYINTERHGAPEETGLAPQRPPEHFRPQDQLPSVIINTDQPSRSTPDQSADVSSSQPRSTETAAAETAAVDNTQQPTPRQAADSQAQPAAQSESPQRSVASSAARTRATDGETQAETQPSVSSIQVGNMTRRATGQALEEQQQQNQQPQQPEQPGIGTPLGQLFLPQFFGPEGEAPTREQQEAAHRARFADDAQQQLPPSVERVNPDYPPPPGTPEQLEMMRQQIENILAGRAEAERAAQRMEDQEQTLEADQAPIQQAIEGAQGGITAVQAHEQAIARKEQANQEQQQRQTETGSLVSGYPSRAAGLTALTIPLGVFEGFTSLASHLPGDAGAAMADMNRDARNIQDAFAQMATAMVTQNEAQPERQQELAGQQSRVQATNEQATATGENVEESLQSAQNLQEDNEAQLSSARDAREQAQTQERELDQAAETRQQEADTLAAEMQAWAQQHKAARSQAVEATAQELEAQGNVILEKNEG